LPHAASLTKPLVGLSPAFFVDNAIGSVPRTAKMIWFAGLKLDYSSPTTNWEWSLSINATSSLSAFTSPAIGHADQHNRLDDHRLPVPYRPCRLHTSRLHTSGRGGCMLMYAKCQYNAGMD